MKAEFGSLSGKIPLEYLPDTESKRGKVPALRLR